MLWMSAVGCVSVPSWRRVSSFRSVVSFVLGVRAWSMRRYISSCILSVTALAVGRTGCGIRCGVKVALVVTVGCAWVCVALLSFMIRITPVEMYRRAAGGGIGCADQPVGAAPPEGDDVPGPLGHCVTDLV